MQQTTPDGWHLPYERYPFATCELGPGQQSTYHRRVRISPMDAYALSLCKLGSGNNLIGYYMYHGGTNQIGKHSTFQESRATGYPNDYPIRNYDFDTALSEYGEARPQYGMLNLLHLFAEDFGDRLAPMPYVPSKKTPTPEDGTTPRAALRTDGRSGFGSLEKPGDRGRGDLFSRHRCHTGRVLFLPVPDAGGGAGAFLCHRPAHLPAGR